MNNRYTERVVDTFDPVVATLDIVIYAVLRSVGITPMSLTSMVYGGMVVDERATNNAQTMLAFFAGRHIDAIKAIREASGLGLKDSKQAWDQTVSTYGGQSYYIAAAKAAAARGDRDAAMYYINLA